MHIIKQVVVGALLMGVNLLGSGTTTVHSECNPHIHRVDLGGFPVDINDPRISLVAKPGDYPGLSGYEYAGPSGAMVFSTISGKVVEVGESLLNDPEINSGRGNYLIIEDIAGYKSIYSHLGEIHVAVGDAVQMGQAIGRMGDSGRVDGIALHYQLVSEEY